MTEPLDQDDPADEFDPEPDTFVPAGLDAPRHGFQGDRRTLPTGSPVPAALSIAVSRESGARGGTIARLVARKSGRAIYDQELLEYIANDAVARQILIGGLSAEAKAWSDARMEVLKTRYQLGRDPAIEHLAAVTLALATDGNIVLVGRGAGVILPRATTLHVRVVAPVDDRIAFMGQWLRLPTPEARVKVRLRDERRNQFMQLHFGVDPTRPHQYDLLLNSTRLGEEGVADLILAAAAVRAPKAARGPERGHDNP